MTDGLVGTKSALPKPGDVVGGAFRIVQRLGAGGMGAVYEVERTDGSDERLALKLMLPHLVDDKEFTARFLREARAARVIESEHVARVTEVGNFDDGSLYMVMPLLRGRDLDRELKERGRIPIEEAVAFILEVCDAIAAAHAHGIIHRDIKPANLFVETTEGGAVVARVLDFGISKARRIDVRSTRVPTLTQADSTMGSPKYMSPEQLRNAKAADARSDIWSLGVILYRMVSAALPFEANTLGAYAHVLANEAPVPLTTALPEAPPELARVVMRCLEKDPKRRYQTVRDLAAALLPFAPASSAALVLHIAGHADLPPESITFARASLEVPDAPTIRMPELGRRPQRRTNRWIAAALALIVGGVLAAITTRYWHPTPPEADGAAASATATTAASSASSPATGIAPARPR